MQSFIILSGFSLLSFANDLAMFYVNPLITMQFAVNKMKIYNSTCEIAMTEEK
jgi:hypothetical protein